MKGHGAIGKSTEEKKQRIGKLLSELRRRELSIDQVPDFLGVVLKTAKNLVNELRLAGRVEYDGLVVRLPKEEEPAQETFRTAIFPPLDDVITLLPTAGHRAFMRLLLGTTVSRFYLAATTKDGWPAGVIYGPTGSLKTGLAVIAAQAFGRREEAIVRVLGRETQRSLLGRRVSTGKGKMSFSPAEYLQEPLLCLDECDSDKVSDDIRKHIILLMQGDSVQELEGVKFTVKATPFLTFNAGSIPSWLHRAYLRRSFVFDTNGDYDRRTVTKSALEIFGNVPKLSLSSLRPAVKAVPNEFIAELNGHCARFLTDEGVNLFDARYISKCAIGYTSLGRMSLKRAILHVGKDYLTVTSTLNRVKGAFAGYFDHLLAGLPAESLPAVVEPDVEEEEPEGFSLADLMRFWWESYAGGWISGIEHGQKEYASFLIAGEWCDPLPYHGNGDTEQRKPLPQYIMSQVVHVLGLPGSIVEKQHFGDSDVKRIHQVAEAAGYHDGKNVGWNRYRDCNELQAKGDPCPYAWWSCCVKCKLHEQWNKRQLTCGKNVVQMQRRGDTWER